MTVLRSPSAISSVNFAQQHYNYDAMCDQLNFYNNEVAKLISMRPLQWI